MEPFRHEEMMMEDYDVVNDIIDTMMDVYDELDGAKKYILSAFKLQEHDPDTAAKLVTMSSDEKHHSEVLSAGVTAMLKKAKEMNSPCYETLSKVWTHVKARQDGYRAWIEHMHERIKN